MQHEQPDDGTQPTVVGPDGVVIVRPSKLRRANQFAATILSAEKWPLLKLALLIGGVVWWLASQVEHWSDKRAAEQDKTRLAVAEGTFYPPNARLFLWPNACDLRSEDARDIAEAVLEWRIYAVDLADPRDVFLWAVPIGDAASTHTLRPRERIRAEFPRKALPSLCGENDPPCRGDCVVVAECVATYHRDKDRAAFSQTRRAVVRPGKPCEVTPLNMLGLGDPPEFADRARRAQEKVERAKLEMERMIKIDWFRGSPKPLTPSPP